MKKSIVILLFVLSVSLYGQEAMPDVFSLSTSFERIEIVRMKQGTDLLDGLNRFIREKSIDRF